MPATVLLAISLTDFIWLVVGLFIMFSVLSIVVMSMIWLERKLLGRLQLRLGPTRTGPMGLLQPVADAVKFWTCNGSLLMPGGMIGAVGACLLFGNWGPHIARDIIKACLDGRYAEARELQERINRIDFLGMSWGVGVQKTGLSLLGYEGTMPRKPNLPLSATQISEVKDALIEARILNFDGTPAPQI